MDEQSPALRVPALNWLWNARVQRVDGPAPGLFAFTLYAGGSKQVLLVSVQSGRCGVGLSAARPSGLPASAFVRRLRVAIENARFERADWRTVGEDSTQAAGLELRFARVDESAGLLADFAAGAPNLLLLDAGGQILGASDERARRARFPGRGQSYRPAARGRVAPLLSPEQAERAGERLLATGQQQRARDERAELRARASAALRRAQRKVAAIRGDLARIEEVPRLRREANLLLCHLRELAPGADHARLLDESLTPAEWLDLALDPACSAQQNAERRFARARRLERGTAIASARLADAERDADALAAFVAELDTLEPQALAEHAAQLGLKQAGAAEVSRRTRASGERLPYRTFEGSGGAPILVGKSAADNDALTLRVARPHDLWLHARDVQGAHVIVPRERNAAPTPELLLDAAHLAAHFSDARGELLTEVQHTERRHLRKPKGSAPGAVRIDRERVLRLRVEPDRLQRLLASERKQT
jgi:predicted ribosome quality control (RQC) complex YloA/Tae2 family protein